MPFSALSFLLLPASLLAAATTGASGALSASDARALSTYGCLDAVNLAAYTIYQSSSTVLAECQAFSWSSNPANASASLVIPQTSRSMGVTLRMSTVAYTSSCSWANALTASDFSASNAFTSSLSGNVAISTYPRKVCIMLRCDSSSDGICSGITYSKTFTPPKCTSYSYKTFSPEIVEGYSDKDDCLVASSSSTVTATLSIPQSVSTGYQGVELQVGFVSPSSDCVMGTYQKQVSTTTGTSLSISNLAPLTTNLKLCIVAVCNSNTRYSSCKGLQLKLDYNPSNSAATPITEKIAAGFLALIIAVAVCVCAASSFFARRRIVQQKPLWGAGTMPVVVSSQPQPQPQLQIPVPGNMTQMPQNLYAHNYAPYVGGYPYPQSQLQPQQQPQQLQPQAGYYAAYPQPQ